MLANFCLAPFWAVHRPHLLTLTISLLSACLLCFFAPGADATSGDVFPILAELPNDKSVKMGAEVEKMQRCLFAHARAWGCSAACTACA